MATKLLTPFLLLSGLAAANTIHMNIARDPAVQEAQLRNSYLRNRALSRRDNTITEALTNEEQDGLYAANVTVGTPGQKLSLQIDTGSSDVWVPVAGSAVCNEPIEEGGGCPGGTCEFSIFAIG